MDDKKSGEILANYKKKSEEILDKMMAVMLHASRKVDSYQYRQVLENIDKEIAKQ